MKPPKSAARIKLDMKRKKQRSKRRRAEAMARNRGLYSCYGPWKSECEDERAENFGFLRGEAEELACQGGQEEFSVVACMAAWSSAWLTNCGTPIKSWSSPSNATRRVPFSPVCLHGIILTTSMCKVQILLPWCDIQRLLIMVSITEILFKLVFED